MASQSVIYRLIARDDASKTFGKVGGSASKLEKGLGKLGKAAGAAGAAIAVGLGKAAKDAAEFQTEMTKISTQAGGTAKDVQVLSKAVLKLGTTTQQGPQALAESLYHLKSVGLDNADAMKALRQASDLAAVGGASLEDTTNALAGAWRSGIKGAGSFHEAVSTVNAIIGAGNMRMSDFIDAIGTGILPSAKSFGLSLKQVGAALALMTDEGIPANSAATRLRMSFSLLGAPSAAAEKQLKKIGLTGLQLATAMRGKDGIIGAISLLKSHLDKSGLSAAKQSQILSRAFGGGKSSSGILTLVNNLDVLRQKQDQVNKSTGKFDSAVKQQRKTAEAQWHLLTSNLEVASIKIGTKILPPLTSFVHYVVATAAPAVAGFGRTMVNKFVPVNAIQREFGQVKGAVGDFIAGFKGTKKAAKSLWDDLIPPSPSPHLGSGQTGAKATPLPSMPHYGSGDVAPTTGVQLPKIKPMPHGGSNLVAPLVAAQKKPPKSAAQRFGEEVRKAISGGIDGINWGKLGGNLGKGIGTAIGWLGKHTADVTKSLVKALSGIDWVGVGSAVGASAFPFTIGFVNNLLSPLFSGSFWKKHWEDVLLFAVALIPIGRIAGPIAKLFSKVPILGPILKGLEKVFVPLGRGVEKLFGFIGKSLFKGFKKVFPNAAATLERESGLLTTRLGVWGLDLLKAGKNAVRGMGRGIAAGFEWVLTKVGQGISLLLKPFVRAGSWLVKRGTEAVTGLGRGIAAGGRTIGKWTLDHVITPAVRPFATAGSWLLGKGRAVVTGAKDGIVAGAKGLGGWMKAHVISPVTGAFKGAGSWLLGRGRAAVSGLKSGVATAAKGVGGWMKSHVISPAVGAFKHAGSWLISRGRDLISGLISGTWDWLKAKGHSFVSWAGKVKDGIVGAIKSVFKIKSPSRVMAELGGHMMSGLMNGLLRGKDVLQSTVKGLFHSPLDAAKNLLKNGISVLGFFGKNAKKYTSELFGDLGSFLGLGKHAKGTTAVMDLGKKMMLAAGWGQAQWPALLRLWTGESGWNPRAENASSGAYGIPQALPASKMASAGSDWRTNPATQIKWGLGYIKSRYGSPQAALDAWMSRSPHWYDSGGLARGMGYMPKATPLPERVLSPRQTAAFERLVDAITGNGGGQQPLVGQLTVQAPQGASAGEVVQTALYQLRVARRRGVHTR